MISADTDHDSDVLALTGASAALALSEMPFEKTIAGVRVGLVDGQYVVNPTFPQRKQSRLDLVVAGSKDGIVMVEAGAQEVSEDEAIQALEVAHAAIKDLCAMIDQLAAEAGRKKLPKPEVKVDTAFQQAIESKALALLSDAMRIKGKLENYGTVARVEKEIIAGLADDQAARQGRGQGHPARAAGEGAARRDSGPRRPPRRPQVRRDPPDQHREHRAAADRTVRRCSRAARPRPWSP